MRITFSGGHLGKVIMIRVLPGSDIIEGIEVACQRLDIKSAVITCCIGSLQRASLLIAVPLENKIGAGYGPPMDFDGPLEFLGGQGSIGQEEDESLFIHMHGMLSDKDGNVHGGHLIKGKNPVLITCEIMINEMKGIRMTRTYDPEIDMKVLTPS